MSDVLLRLEHVEKRYGARTVLSVSGFELRRGDCVLLAGHNGSGKSTLIRIIAGVSPVSRGRVERSSEFDDIVIGLVPQGGCLYADMTLRQNLAVFSSLYRSQPSRPAEETWFIRDTSLKSYIDVRAGEMSGGIRQLATFACVLSAGPHALLLDEPSSELDAAHAQLLYDWLAKLRSTMTFIVMSSHDSNHPGFHSRTVVLEKGAIAR
jgi:ABC-type multidrug transport system ATPase subunit